VLHRTSHSFWDRQMLLGDIEAIPTPGHTVGSACYQYRSPHGKNYLFTGDTIWPARGSWISVTFEDDAKQSSHRASLDLLAMWCSRLSAPVTHSKRLRPPIGRPRRRPQRRVWASQRSETRRSSLIP
jgi:glyoxylase-like metal-dependent hydrolase (beta-lactamase superfamily II)